MGLGIIIFGFMCLHFQFLDVHVYNVQVFSVSISLIILILGFLYEYQRRHRKEYFYFIGLACLMVGISFIQYTRFEYLLLQTILYSTFLVFVQKEFPQYPKQKSYHIWILIYVISAIVKTLTIPGGPISTIYNIYINEVASLIVCICVIVTLIHLLSIKKLIHVEMRPQPIAVKKPFYIHVFIILMTIAAIVLTQYTMVEHAYDSAIQYKIYQISNSQLNIKYVTDFYVEYPHGAMSSGGFVTDIELKNENRPNEIGIKLNEEIISKGYMEYGNDGSHQYYQQYSSGWANKVETSPKCEIIIDGISYPANVKEMHLDEYRYADKDIRISHCLIENGIIFMLPRIEVFHQNLVIDNIQILDKDGHALIYNTQEYYKRKYRDGVTLYHEMPIHEKTKISQAPYYIVIQYHDQNNIIKKEYPLTYYETHLP